MTTPGKRLRTAFCDRFGLDVPIVLAGMGLASKAELAAAVSNAGGLGFIGSTEQTPEEMRAEIRRVRSLTDRPFGVDLLFPSSVLASAEARVLPESLAPFLDDFRAELGLPAWAERRPQLEGVHGLDLEGFRAQLAVVLEQRVPCFASGLGLPAWAAPLLHERGTAVFALVGTVRHARQAVEAGADVIVAQGYEAGGHTGRVGTLALVPQVVDAVGAVPVLAAGGIVDGRGVAAALALGAQGVWMGTRFLGSEEANVSRFLQSTLLQLGEDDTERTRGWSGRPQRTMRNRFTRAWEEGSARPLHPAIQRITVRDIEESAEAAGNADLMRLSAGQGVGLVRQVSPAAAIVDTVVSEAVDAVLRLGSLATGEDAERPADTHRPAATHAEHVSP